MRGDDAVHGNDCHVSGAAADVHDHVASCLADVHAGTDQGGNGLIDQVCLSGAGTHGSFHDSTLFHVCDKGRHTDDDAGLGEPVAGDL